MLMHPVRNTLVPVQDVISRDPTVGGPSAIGPSVTDAVTGYTTDIALSITLGCAIKPT